MRTIIILASILLNYSLAFGSDISSEQEQSMRKYIELKDKVKPLVREICRIEASICSLTNQEGSECQGWHSDYGHRFNRGTERLKEAADSKRRPMIKILQN